MEANVAVRPKHKGADGGLKAKNEVKGDKRRHHKKSRDGKSKSRSKGKKKKGGFLCCRRKKKKSTSGGKRKHKKSRTTKKQPHGKRPKTLAPVPNEQLGDVVLVKNIDKPTTPSGEKASKEGVAKTATPSPAPPPPVECVSPFKSGKGAQMIANLNLPKTGDSKEKVAEPEEEEKKTSDGKKPSSSVEKKPKAKKASAVSKSKEDVKESSEMDERKEMWLKMAKSFVDQDANLAVNDFELIGGYIPPHVTKHQFAANMSLNRFADVVCLDHSRVTLNDASYIHASHVEIDANKKAILTQLPLPHTAADFWQMCIEQQVKCVLVLLTDQEYDELGGEFVFPLNQDFLHFAERSIRVGEFKQVEIAKGWNLRVLSVTNGTYKSFLHVHHYKAWPHNSIPRGGPGVVKQVWQLQSVLRKYAGPHVYMSLSGCGRAGSWALLEMAHSALHNDPSLDMAVALKSIRNSRMHAVQTVSQFSFVYTLIAEHILGNGFCKLVKGAAAKGDADDEESIQAVLRQMTIEPP